MIINFHFFKLYLLSVITIMIIVIIIIFTIIVIIINSYYIMLQIYHYCIHYLHDNDNIFRCSPLVILSADATISSFSTSLSQRFLPLRFLSSLFVFFSPLPCFDLIRLISAFFLNIFSFFLSPLCSIYWLFPCSPFPVTFLHVLLYYSCFFLLFFNFSFSFYTLLVYFHYSFPFCFPPFSSPLGPSPSFRISVLPCLFL